MHPTQLLHNSEHPTCLAAEDASCIPPLGHAEATRMSRVELERFLALVEGLSPEDWTRPTACTLWDVREMVAHVVGSAAAPADRSQAMRQSSPRAQRPYRRAGLSRLDAQNQILVADRAHASLTDLIAELREVGPRSVAARDRMPALVRALRLPLGLFYPMDRIWVPIGYMSDLIMTRDMWMHRLDICRATGREMELTREHDGRMTALVVRDLAQTLPSRLGGSSVLYELSGPAGGTWRIGKGTPSARIGLDALDFHLLAAGRMPAEETRSLATMEGDMELGNRALARSFVVY